MNIKISGFCVFLLYSLFSCNKDTEPPVDVPEPPNNPLQLVMKIVRYEFNGALEVDSTSYEYDGQGRITATIDPRTNTPTRKFIYDSDNLVALVDFINNKPDTLKNPVKLLDDGNTIILDHTRPSPDGGYDTIVITFKWSGDQMLESWTYLHFARNEMPHFQKSIISYDTNGNFKEHVEHFPEGGSQWQARALAYDDKKNFFRTIPRLNYIFMGWGYPYATRSVSNPVRGERAFSGETEYIWTYNEQGYPLTMQAKGKDYVMLELQYNR